jgi:hypothetical protein
MEISIYISVVALLFSFVALCIGKIIYDDSVRGFLTGSSVSDAETKRLRVRVEEALKEIESLKIRVELIEEEKRFPYGIKKDGTPKRKPGRPIKNKRDDWE